MVALAGLVVIVLVVLAIQRRFDVRFVLLVAALALGALAGDVRAIVTSFLTGFTDERFLLPLGTCMGFAFVLRHTQCDRHLIHLLARPLRRFRSLLVPGLVLVAMAVNVPIVSQSSTAVAVGTVLVPVLRAAGVPPLTIAAALALGASIGGELLNPGAVELRSISRVSGATGLELVGIVWPLLAIHLAVTLPLFWWLSRRADGPAAALDEPVADAFAVRPLLALVPLVPLGLLFATAMPEPFVLLHVPDSWLLTATDRPGLRDGRLVGLAMLVGVVAAALCVPRKAPDAVKAFFEGAGYALTNITALIVCAGCFGNGIALVGLADYLRLAVDRLPEAIYPLAMLLPLGFAWVSGSGMAATESLYQFFHDATPEGADPLRVGAVVALSAATGRTLSPAAAAVLLSASLVGVDPLTLFRRLAVPLLLGLSAAVALAMALR